MPSQLSLYFSIRKKFFKINRYKVPHPRPRVVYRAGRPRPPLQQTTKVRPWRGRNIACGDFHMKNADIMAISRAKPMNTKVQPTARAKLFIHSGGFVV